jgi:hypothetical protein
MNASTMHTLNMRDDNELNFMVFGFGYFLVRILTEYEGENIASLVEQVNTIIDAINIATTSEAILDATVRKEGSLVQLLCIGPKGELQITAADQEVPKDYRRFYVNDFETNGVLLSEASGANSEVLAHIIHCLCYGRMGMPERFRTVKAIYNNNASNSIKKIETLISVWRNPNEHVSTMLPISTGDGGASVHLSLVQAAYIGPTLTDNKYFDIILRQFSEQIQQQQQQQQQVAELEESTLNKDKFAFAALVILGLAIIAAANIISWANLIKIALLSSIAAKAGIAAAGIVIGGVLLFLANRLRYKRDIFYCPCDRFCEECCARKENSQEELLVRARDIDK